MTVCELCDASVSHDCPTPRLDFNQGAWGRAILERERCKMVERITETAVSYVDELDRGADMNGDKLHDTYTRLIGLARIYRALVA